MKRYIPVILLAGTIAISAPFMRPAHSQPLAERLSRINAARKQPSQVVVLQYHESSTPQPSLAYHGLVIWNSNSSAGAPTFPNYPDNTYSYAQAFSDLISDGFKLVQDRDYVALFIKE